MADIATVQRAATYSYTDAGRLSTAVGTWGSDVYTWDANSNRTRADRTIASVTTSDVATLTPGTNRLAELRDGSGVLSRASTNRAGCDITQTTRAGAPTLGYSYDARGRLIAVTSGASTIASYGYDWREQRVAATSTEVAARHYLYAPAATPSYSWITVGNLNQPLLLTDASGAVTASTTRDPWGNPILLAGGTPLDLGYPGQWKDPSTGLFQNWHRDYDPTTGRYVEADPLGLGGGSNLFAYVGGDPVNAVDPTGLAPGDKWYGYNDTQFKRWFHRCVKQLGDRDGTKGEIAEAYQEWNDLGRPGPDNCRNGRPRRPPSRSPTPSKAPICDKDCKDNAETVVIIGGIAYIVYRCIRMIPSLFPPAWPTIPANAAIP